MEYHQPAPSYPGHGHPYYQPQPNDQIEQDRRWTPSPASSSPDLVSPVSTQQQQQQHQRSVSPYALPRKPSDAYQYIPVSVTSPGLNNPSSSGHPQMAIHPSNSQDSLQIIDEPPSSKGGLTTQSNAAQYGHPPDKPSRWNRTWSWGWNHSSMAMYLLLVVGIVTAVGHHVFYTRLDGRPADAQLEMMRYGNLLAYVVKASLAAAIVFSYQQQLWATVRRKSLQLETIDSLFAANTDVRAMMNLEFLTKGKVAFVLALLAWISPLIVIFTPSTLTVAPRTEIISDRCPGIRTLNFESETRKNWRNADKIDGFNGLSLSLWNCTLPNTWGTFTPYNETFFDYWTGPSVQSKLVTTLSASSGKAVQRENASLETCGSGWNCTYTIKFTGPGYKCEEIARGRNNNEQAEKLRELNAPFGVDQLLPDGGYSYIAHATLGEYSSRQMADADIGGMPKINGSLMDPKDFPKELGSLRTEPVVWIGHSDPVPGPGKNHEIPLDPKASNWTSSYVPTIFRCEHYVTDYTVQFNHTLSEQRTTVLKREYIRPVIDTTFQPEIDANDGTLDNITATPKESYVRPLDENYRLTAAYHSIGLQARLRINGTVQQINFAADPPGPSLSANTDMIGTRLANKANYLVVPNMMEEFRNYYEEMVLSMLSDPQFVLVTWAAKPDTPSGPSNETALRRDDLKYPCEKSRTVMAYTYRKRDLWIVYSIGILAALLSVGLGAAALSQNNGHVRDTRLSSIVAATRAPVLDVLPWKNSKWGEVPEEIRKTRMEYGVISEEAVSYARSMSGLSPASGDLGIGKEAPKLYYGFAPEGMVGGTRDKGGIKKRTTRVLTFKNWDHHHPHSGPAP